MIPFGIYHGYIKSQNNLFLIGGVHCMPAKKRKAAKRKPAKKAAKRKPAKRKAAKRKSSKRK